MDIDLVYKVGSGATDGDFFELRQSIRSAEMYFKSLGKIYIVGHKPNWLTNVRHIPLEDPYTHNKDANLINKLLLACYDDEISSNFLNMSDDYFFLKEMDWHHCTQIYHNNKVTEIINKKKSGQLDKPLSKWERRVEKTLNMLRIKRLPDHCYETHTPQPINKVLFPHTILNYDYGEGDGMCGNTLYFNALKTQSIELPVEYLRIESKLLTIEEIETLTKDKALLNYTIIAYNPMMSKFLCDRFSQKSKFEL